MLITAKTKLGRKVRCLDVDGGVIMASAVDTTEGWVDLYVPRSGGRVFVDRKKRELVKIRLHTDFDIVTKRGRKLIKVRWSWDGKASLPMEIKVGPLPE